MPAIAERFIFPRLSQFLARYPAIRIEFDFSERFLNLIEGNIDVALRIQKPTDTSLVYRKIASNDLVLCAAPAYLKRSKRPIKKPKDLFDHPFLTMSIHDKVRFLDADYCLGDFAAVRQIVCENGMMTRLLALRGYGVLARSLWDVSDLLESGKLVQILADYPLEAFGDLYAVIPSRRYLAPRVRAFLDFVTGQTS